MFFTLNKIEKYWGVNIFSYNNYVFLKTLVNFNLFKNPQEADLKNKNT